MQRSTQTTSYAPENNSESAAAVANVAASSSADKSDRKFVKEYAVVMKDIDYDAYRLAHEIAKEPKAKIKNKLMISRVPKKAANKDVRETSVIGYPACYFSVSVRDSDFGRSRSGKMTWIARESIAQCDVHCKKLFELMIDELLTSRHEYMVPPTVMVDVDGKRYTYTQYHDLRDEKDAKGLKKSNPTRYEELEVLIEKVETEMEKAIWDICNISKTLGRVEGNDDIRSKYITMSSYPKEKKDNIDEAEFARRKEEGNIKRIFFFGKNLKDNKQLRTGFLAMFCGDGPNRIPVRASKKDPSCLFFYDLDMTKKISPEGVPHAYRCGINIREEYFWLHHDDNTKKYSIRLREEFSSANIYNIVPTPAEAIDSGHDDGREAESNAQDAQNMQATSSVGIGNGADLSNRTVDDHQADDGFVEENDDEFKNG